MLAYTIIAGNYSAFAQVLARSFLQHHPGARFATVIVDHPSEPLTELGEISEIVRVDEIDFGPEGYGRMAVSYDVTEFSTAVKPFAARHFIDQGEDIVFYIDPDILVLTELTSLMEGVRSKSIALTPHCLEPIARDGRMLRESDIMMSGIYNLGFIGVGPGAEPFLDWWCERLRRDAIVDPANMLFTDQRWIDLAVPIFDPYTERSPRYNVAYWNFSQRPLRIEDGRFFIEDEPLGFFHFSGFDPKHPYLLSKYMGERPRTLISENPTLSVLLAHYSELLEAAGHSRKSRDPYSWAKIPPDITLTPRIRRHYRQCLLRADQDLEPYPPDPTRSEEYEDFVRWLRDPMPGEPSGLSRFDWLIWAERPDVQAGYPETGHGDTDRFHRWMWTDGVAIYGRPSVLPLPLVPPAGATRVSVDEPLRRGVRVSGYLRAESGVGEAGRLALRALAGAGVAAGAHSYSRSPARQQAGAEPVAESSSAFDTNLICVNADMLPSFSAEAGPAYFHRRYSIGQWFWELGEFPSRFDNAFTMIDEVWAATDHMRDAMAARTTKPVVTMPLPLLAPPVDPEIDRAALGLPDDRFIFLFTFDFFSIVNRKNPLGLIDAFSRAFRKEEGPLLVIKSINGAERLVDLERVRYHRGDRTDILIWDDYLDRPVQGALVAQSDAYVSLHRAEGLGLTMSEAMALGKPVVATNYSGNVDFMDADTAFLVPWTPVAIGPGSEPYPATTVWADPDLDAAAAQLRAVYDAPDRARQVGEAARRKLLTEFSAEACGSRMRDRLDDIWRNR